MCQMSLRRARESVLSLAIRGSKDDWIMSVLPPFLPITRLCRPQMSLHTAQHLLSSVIDTGPQSSHSYMVPHPVAFPCIHRSPATSHSRGDKPGTRPSQLPCLRGTTRPRRSRRASRGPSRYRPRPSSILLSRTGPGSPNRLFRRCTPHGDHRRY
jgi:hypothetical protein